MNDSLRVLLFSGGGAFALSDYLLGTSALSGVLANASLEVGSISYLASGTSEITEDLTLTSWSQNVSLGDAQLPTAINLEVAPNAASGAVPEPSTWAMMGLGFAGLGFAGWRRVRGDHRTIEV